MRRNFRKLVVCALASVLAVGTPVSALAEEAGQNDAAGAARTEKLVKPEVYQVVLPTDVNGIFDFILDPQKLIEETNAAAYGGKSFEKGSTVFFHRTDGQAAEEYSSSSDHVTIVNRSNVPVEVQVDVNILPDSLGGIRMSDDQGFTGDDSASLYIALTDGEYTVPVRMEGSYIRATIPAAPENAFEYRYDQGSRQYTYGLKSDVSNIQFPEYSFQLTGAANEKGDWAKLKNVFPMVNVTWKVTPIHNLNSDEGGNAEQSDLEQELSPEQSMFIKQILETVPVEKEDDEDDLDQKEDSEQDKGSNQGADPGQDKNSGQDADPGQDKDSGQDADPGQDKDLGQGADTGQDKDSDQGSDEAQNKDLTQGGEPD